jgi:glycosyltransferase involved in cell wall biosynthesis
LFLSQTLPFPPDGGVAIRTYNILRLLADTFDVTALCFYRSKGGLVDAQLTAHLRALSRFGKTEAFPIPQEHSPARLVLDHARSVASRTVYTRFAYESDRYRRRLAALLRSARFNLVHVDSLDLSAYLPDLGTLPVVCVHHNHESRLLARRAGLERSRIRARYFRHQAALMAAEERFWCPRVTLNVAVSDADAGSLAADAPGGRYLVVPNGVDVETFRPSDQATEGIVFVGGATWFPNRDALGYYADAILPQITSLAGPVITRWIGRARAGDQARYGGVRGLELVGYVDDIRPHVLSAACYVVPLRVGGGTRLKILDAWAMGKAVVSTSVGCEGLAARDGENILIRDEPRAFAEAVALVLRDVGLRKRLESAARSTAEKVYAWPVIGEPMLREYRAIAEL